MLDTTIGRDRIGLTEKLIRPYIRRTPVVEVNGADLGLDSVRMNLKL